MLLFSFPHLSSSKSDPVKIPPLTPNGNSSVMKNALWRSYQLGGRLDSV